jgi:hypothetical protein
VAFRFDATTSAAVEPVCAMTLTPNELPLFTPLVGIFPLFCETALTGAAAAGANAKNQASRSFQGSKNLVIRAVAVAKFLSSHSQMTRIFHPADRNSMFVNRSRSRFAASFGIQKSMRLDGGLEYLQS